MIQKDLSFLDETIAHEAAQFKPYTPDTPPWPLYDKWLLASCLQKAIRRGHSEIAQIAALYLYQLDKQMLQRRILVTAYEDIGIGDTFALKLTTRICTDLQTRKSMSEVKAYMFTADLLAKATKCRAADHIYMISNNAEEGQEIREAINELTTKDKLRCALDDAASIYVRAYAAQKLHQTSKCDAIYFMEQSGVGPCLIDTCSVAASKMRDPLAVYMPLFIKEYPEHKVQHFDIPAEQLNDLPFYAFDPLHTRSGKLAVKRWIKSTPDLQPYTAKQVGMAIFLLECALCDTETTSDKLDALKRKDVEASLRYSGVPLDLHNQLLNIVTNDMGDLNTIRAEIRVDLMQTTPRLLI